MHLQTRAAKSMPTSLGSAAPSVRLRCRPCERWVVQKPRTQNKWGHHTTIPLFWEHWSRTGVLVGFGMRVGRGSLKPKREVLQSQLHGDARAPDIPKSGLGFERRSRGLKRLCHDSNTEERDDIGGHMGSAEMQPCSPSDLMRHERDT